ncbi:MAG: hypothetical protein WCI64_11415 [Chlorobium sp.]
MEQQQQSSNEPLVEFIERVFAPKSGIAGQKIDIKKKMTVPSASYDRNMLDTES